MNTVLITGGAGGQGLSHAIGFANRGYNVAVGDIYELESTIVQKAIKKISEAGTSPLYIKCDVTKENEVEELFTLTKHQYSTIDIVISNAGIMNFGATWELTDEQVKKTIDVNLLGTWRVNKEAAKYMIDQKQGRIINIASTAGLKGTPNLAHYTMSKFGVVGLTKTLAKELGKYGITVNVICPTMAKTPMTERKEFIDYLNTINGTDFKDFEEADRVLKSRRNMGIAFIDPIDITNMIIWVATSKEARLITGATLPIDAGSLL